jgi:hypothetical protein
VLHFFDRTLIISQSTIGNHDCVSVMPRTGNDAIKSSGSERHGSFNRTAVGITHCRGFLERVPQNSASRAGSGARDFDCKDVTMFGHYVATLIKLVEADPEIGENVSAELEWV